MCNNSDMNTFTICHYLILSLLKKVKLDSFLEKNTTIVVEISKEKINYFKRLIFLQNTSHE